VNFGAQHEVWPILLVGVIIQTVCFFREFKVSYKQSELNLYCRAVAMAWAGLNWVLRNFVLFTKM
jgi:hypothetical protein